MLVPLLNGPNYQTGIALPTHSNKTFHAKLNLSHTVGIDKETKTITVIMVIDKRKCTLCNFHSLVLLFTLQCLHL